MNVVKISSLVLLASVLEMRCSFYVDVSREVKRDKIVLVEGVFFFFFFLGHLKLLYLLLLMSNCYRLQKIGL